MPYARLQYNGDNQYTTKDKRNFLLTQETIDKINGLTPSGGGDMIIPIVSELPSNPVDGQLVIDATDFGLKIYYGNRYTLKTLYTAQ